MADWLSCDEKRDDRNHLLAGCRRSDGDLHLSDNWAFQSKGFRDRVFALEGDKGEAFDRVLLFVHGDIHGDHLPEPPEEMSELSLRAVLGDAAHENLLADFLHSNWLLFHKRGMGVLVVLVLFDSGVFGYSGHFILLSPQL